MGMPDGRENVRLGVSCMILVALITAACRAPAELPTASASASGRTDATSQSPVAPTPSPTPLAHEPSITCGDQVDTGMSEMTIAQLLMSDTRFERFCTLVEGTRSEGLGLSWLEIWNWPANRMGDDQEGVTVFAPVNEAFDALDPAVKEALDGGTIDNQLRYSLLGHHYVHRLYPSSLFEFGSQRTWAGAGTVELSPDPLTFGGCNVVETDLRVANGFVHAIDCVVLPQDLLDAVAG
jgi:uncharacterized surface protein with fasciclin (FAS1) repeats